MALTAEEEAAAAALRGDGTVAEVAAGPAGLMRSTKLDPAVAQRELERLERLRLAGENPSPDAEEKLKQPWQPKRRAPEPPSEMQDHNLGALKDEPIPLEAWGGKAVKGWVVFQLEDADGNAVVFQASPPHARDLSNRLLAWAASAQGQRQGIAPQTDGEAG